MALTVARTRDRRRGKIDELTTPRRRVPVPDRLLGALARARRDGISGAEIERRTGGVIKRQTVSAIMARHQQSMDLDRLVILAHALEVSVDWLFEGEDVPRPWIMPSEFDRVSEWERRNAERVLSWIFGTKGRGNGGRGPTPHRVE